MTIRADYSRPVKDLELTQLRANVVTLAKVATLAKIPVITNASVPQGPNGPLIPEIHKFAPHAKYVARHGQINAWDNPDFVAAVEGTGRKALLIAGTIISVCMAEPSLSAIGAGYRVFAVVDASGTYSKMAQEITLARVVQAGVIPVDTAGRLCRTAEDLEPARRRAVGSRLTALSSLTTSS